MELKDLLKQYAIESGEIPEEPVVDDLGLTEQDASDLLEAKVDEICRASELVESLEALADRYSQIPVSDISFESYQFTLGHILTVSGIDIPTSVVCPSFESAEKSEGKSLKDKAKGTIEAIIKWIKEQFGKLRDFILRREKATEAKQQKTAETQKKAEAAILALKHNPRKGYATGQHSDEKPSGKHGSQASANNQAGHVVRNGKGEFAGADDVKRNQHGGVGESGLPVLRLPAWLVKDGEFNHDKVKELLGVIEKGQLAEVLKGNLPDGASIGKADAWADDPALQKKWLQIDASGVFRNTIGKVTSPAGSSKCHKYDLDHIKSDLTALFQAGEKLFKQYRFIEKSAGTAYFDAKAAAEKVQNGARFNTKYVTAHLKIMKVRATLAENTWSAINGTHLSIADELDRVSR